MTRLYYGHPRPRGLGPPDLTSEPLPADGEFYYDEDGEVLPVAGIRLTKEPEAWWRTWLLVVIDVPLDGAALDAHRVQWDWRHESYDLPADLVNSSPRRWVRDEQTVVNLILAHGEDW
jgi:hypothetical protein